MDKIYDLSHLKFENDSLELTIDNQIIKVNLADVSEKLFKASKQERNDYQISPSGYGIHWRLLDEDLSINGILQKYYSNQTALLSSHI